MDNLTDEQLAHLVIGWLRAQCEIDEFPIEVSGFEPARQPIMRIGYEAWTGNWELIDGPAEFVIVTASGLRYRVTCVNER